MPAYYKGQPVFGVKAPQEFIKWQVKAYPDTSVKDFRLFHDGYYYCIASGIIYRTQDFLYYEDVRPISNASDWNIIIHDGTQFIAKRYKLSGVYTSPDAKTWTRIATSGLQLQVNFMTYLKGKYIAWQYGTSGFSPYISTDLTKWNNKTSPGSLSPYFVSTEDILVSTKYYPSGTTPIIYTEDGETFLNCDPLDSALSLTSITYANGIFIACDSNGTVIKSTDGKHWEVAAQNTSYVYLASYKGRFLAFTNSNFTYPDVGYSAKAYPMLISKDGETWAPLEGTYGYTNAVVLNGKLILTDPSNYFTLLIGE